MTAAITLAGPDNIQPLLGLMARCHDECGLKLDDDHRLKTVAPLLDGNPLGAVWLIGPPRAPLGYVLVSFGWSVSTGGMIGWVDEVFVRPSVRRRGIGTEVLHAVGVSLGQAGVTALNVRIPASDETAARFCSRVGFADAGPIRLMTDPL